MTLTGFGRKIKFYKEDKMCLVAMGDFKNGLLNGICSVVSSLDSYQGYFKNDLLEGIGSGLYIDTGEHYVGQWKDYRPHGKGI